MLPGELIQLALGYLGARDLCVAATHLEVETHTEFVLRRRTTGYVHPVQLPGRFSTWASYLLES